MGIVPCHDAFTTGRVEAKTLLLHVRHPPRCSFLCASCNLGDSQNYGYHFGGPYNKDYSILGFILGSPYLGKLPFFDPEA